MPYKKQHVCNKVGCNNLTRNRYCKEHEYIELEQRKNYNKKYNATRTDDKEQAFYKTTGWKQARKAALVRDNYLCQDCMKMGYIVPAQTVHHIIPIKIMWQLRLIIDNMICLCESCHQERHRKLNEKENQIILNQCNMHKELKSQIARVDRTSSPASNLCKNQQGERRGELCKLFREIGKGGLFLISLI